MKIRKLTVRALMLLALVTVLSGCTTPKDVAYFQDFDQVMEMEIQDRNAITIKPGDKLQILIHSKDPQLAGLFNLPIVSTRLGQGSTAQLGGTSTTYSSYGQNTTEGVGNYTVSSEGTIEFPVLGTLKIEGMTREQLAGFIKGELMGKDLIKDPTVIVEFLNMGVSVLGEVVNPGRFLMNRDELTVLDAIAMAGDLKIQGKRQNIKVVRKEGDNVKVYTVDITDGKSLYNNPGFYLQQNDVVYVEPNNIRKRETTANGNTPLTAGFWMSVLSLLSSLAVLVVNIAK